MSAPRSPSAKSFTVHIPRNALKIAGIAFGVGVLLFVLVWFTGRDKEFFRADPAAQTPQETAQVEPLPEPLAAAAGSSDMPDAKPAPVEEEAPKLVETPPPPPAPVAEAAPAAPAATGNSQPMPIAGQSPPPAYPAAALRAGETGSVVVRVDVDATGYPNNVTVIQRSGSRELDRAATDAVRRWRFTPAQSNGQAVPGSIEVPFDFKTQ
ncbi:MULTISPECIES: energy transducer TonB [Stenotrophomonas maltophilia group]|uniref:energy transducer TonB n=1 Tax=Stenotrophomonas maltophilia group TaxID=995085 RepID=UPI001E4280E8|nr:MULTISPECIES: energy transducer TonB [Stenotrophomonas maltophilia group]MCF3498372.1 TonB family protein [Stenotrophomonas maltophilia]MDQ4679904.1 TonB family protein [Stenotrophomonas maltophilia group sp. RNC7]UGB20246.1 TonB family protein [Stenotrophomonas maltophilia]